MAYGRAEVTRILRVIRIGATGVNRHSIKVGYQPGGIGEERRGSAPRQLPSRRHGALQGLPALRMPPRDSATCFALDCCSPRSPLPPFPGPGEHSSCFRRLRPSPLPEPNADYRRYASLQRTHRQAREPARAQQDLRSGAARRTCSAGIQISDCRISNWSSRAHRPPPPAACEPNRRFPRWGRSRRPIVPVPA